MLMWSLSSPELGHAPQGLLSPLLARVSDSPWVLVEGRGAP